MFDKSASADVYMCASPVTLLSLYLSLSLWHTLFHSRSLSLSLSRVLSRSCSRSCSLALDLAHYLSLQLDATPCSFVSHEIDLLVLYHHSRTFTCATRAIVLSRQHILVRDSVAVCCSVLQHVAVCCSVLQRVALLSRCCIVI